MTADAILALAFLAALVLLPLVAVLRSRLTLD